jgi:putative flippase GtrA
MKRFSTYILIGSLVGAMSIGLREILGLCLPKTPLGYALSVGLVYGFGVFGSFILNGRITFRVSVSETSRRSIAIFVAISVLNASLASALAVGLRCSFLDSILGPTLAPASSMVCAALALALPSFWLKKNLVFGPVSVDRRKVSDTSHVA